MPQRRTLNLPDAPGVWLILTGNGDVFSVDVYWLNGRLCFGPGIEVEEMAKAVWQGPIEWEYDNA